MVWPCEHDALVDDVSQLVYQTVIFHVHLYSEHELQMVSRRNMNSGNRLLQATRFH